MGIARRLSATGVTPKTFVFTVLVTAGGSVTLPIADYNGLTPNFTVNWGDGHSGNITYSTDPNRIHTYTSAGTYTISMAGFCPSFSVNNGSTHTQIKSIVQWGNLGFRKIDFYGCSGITSIPTPTPDIFGDTENFANFMHSTGITTIPSGFFDYSINATVFTDVFSFTNITSIPSGLFTYNTNATTFNSAFNTCTKLASVPSNLFDTNVNVVNFGSTFRNCYALTSPLQFTYNLAVTTFTNVYYMATTANAMSGTAPTIWTRSPQPAGSGAFHNCLGLSNYSSIPSNFK
jgi:hypothetical protein